MKRFESKLSPLSAMLVISGAIFAVEMIIMAAFLFLFPDFSSIGILADSVLLILILSPLFFFVLFRPMARLAEQRKEALEELKAERDRVKNYLDIAGSLIVILDRDARVVLLNRKGCEVLGVSDEEAVGKDWIENFVPERLRADIRKVFSYVMAGNPVVEFHENPVLTRGGGERTISFHNRIIYEKGAPAGVLSSGEDITERKRVEGELKESETRYRLIHNTVFDAILTINTEDIIKDCNPSAERIFGYSKEELVGMDLKRLMPEKYRAAHLYGIRRFLATGKLTIIDKIYETEALRKNGEVFPIELVINAISVGGEINFTGMIRDITERKKVEEEREKFRTRLNQSQKMEAIGRFAGGIAHDFNNVLTAIRGNAELAMEDLDKKHPAYPKIDGIIGSVLLASKLTTQLLLFSRGQQFEMVAVNVNRTIENLLVIITRLIGEGITISTVLAPGLWPVKADMGNLEQVIMNLAINAKDAMPGGGKLSIKTENTVITEKAARTVPDAKHGRTVLITVTDTGTGMEGEVLQHIFEPFFTTKRPGKGTGFGLSVVYGIIKQHGGWIRVASKPGVGTTFRIYLPALPEASPLGLGGRGRDGAQKGKKALLVNAGGGFGESARRALEGKGFAIEEAGGGQGARERLEKEDGALSIVLADVPGAEGAGLAFYLSAKKGVKALFAVRFNDLRSFKDGDGVGLTFLMKPFSERALLKAIDKSLGGGHYGGSGQRSP